MEEAILKHSTKYLTGRDTDFFEPEQSIFIDKRIKEMRSLMKDLRLKSQKMNKQSVVYQELETRYTEVETAVKWWNNIRTK